MGYNISYENFVLKHIESVNNDPDLDIEWPVENPILSNKDISAGKLEDIKV